MTLAGKKKSNETPYKHPNKTQNYAKLWIKNGWLSINDIIVIMQILFFSGF